MDSASDPKRIDRVILACIQCRSRHIKCDAVQPSCTRCAREGKECTYQKSRRGGLDKAALARRRLRLQQESEGAQQNSTVPQMDNSLDLQSSAGLSIAENRPVSGNHVYTGPIEAISSVESQSSQSSPLAFQISNNRLLELYYEHFWPAFPIVFPVHHLQARVLNQQHGLDDLLLVMYWIGSIHAPWTQSAPYYEAALKALDSIHLPRTPFSVQALMLFSLAQFHCDLRDQARKKMNLAVAVALELHMNQKVFAYAYGEANPVLEECWRRTYYMLNVCDQHFAVITNSPIYTLLTVPNFVDLPCDDVYFESGVRRIDLELVLCSAC